MNLNGHCLFVLRLSTLSLTVLVNEAGWGASVLLEGQNKGETNTWYAGNLQPCAGGSTTSKVRGSLSASLPSKRISIGVSSLLVIDIA